MNLDEQAINEVIELFNIETNSEDYEDNSNNNNTQSSDFTDLTEDISSIVDSMDNKGAILEVKENNNLGSEENKPSKQDNLIEENNVGDIEDLIAESIEEAEILTQKQQNSENESKQDLIESSTKATVDIDQLKSMVEDEDEDFVVKGEQIFWNLDSPSDLYDEFYKIKRKYVHKFCSGKQFNFDKYYRELHDCKVDISTEVLDKEVLMPKMDALVQCIERVTMIQVKINHQYFIWKRYAELLRGALSRIQYLKPALKQDGLILEHMNDVEFYAERLHGLHLSADKVMRSLDRAFEALNRKVSIMLASQSKNPDRVSNDDSYVSNEIKTNTSSQVVNNVENFKDYDGLEVGVKVTANTKPGEIDWGDIF